MTDKGRGFIHPLGEHIQFIYTMSFVEYFSIRKRLQFWDKIKNLELLIPHPR
jgi:hypothetical protein